MAYAPHPGQVAAAAAPPRPWIHSGFCASFWLLFARTHSRASRAASCSRGLPAGAACTPSSAGPRGEQRSLSLRPWCFLVTLRRSYQARHRVGACGSCLFPAVIYTLHQGGLHRHSLRPARWREPGEGHELSLAGLFRPDAPRLRHEWPPKRKRGTTSLHLKTGTTARRLPAAWRGLRRARRGGFSC